MELEDDHTAKYAGFDPNSLESDIIFELSQSKRLDQSIEFADEIHRQLVNISGRAPKGVRQAGFWVLWATSAPAVLVELDFICNPRSENTLFETGQGRWSLRSTMPFAPISTPTVAASPAVGYRRNKTDCTEIRPEAT